MANHAPSPSVSLSLILTTMKTFLGCLFWIGTAIAVCGPVLEVQPGTTCGEGEFNVRGTLSVDHNATLREVVGTEFTKSDGSGTLGDALGGVPASAKCARCADLYVPDCHVPVCFPEGGSTSADPHDAWVCTVAPALAYPNGTNLGCGDTGKGICAQMSPAPQPARSMGCATTLNFTTIAITRRTTCGIMAPETGPGKAGRVACWGDLDKKGGRGAIRYKSSSPVMTLAPSGGSIAYPFVQIQTASEMFYALDSAGELYVWGYTRSGNSMSPTGLGGVSNLLLQPTWEDVHNVALPTFLAGGETITQLAHTEGNTLHMCFISSLGKVYCWGDNANGQCGRNDTVATVPLSEATEAPANPKDVGCSMSHTLVSTSVGPPYLWCGGKNLNGECSADGTGTTDWVTWGTPVLPAVGITGVIDLSMATSISGVVVEINNGAADNRVYVWGYYADSATHGLPAGLGVTPLPASQVSPPPGAAPPLRYKIVHAGVTALVMQDGRLSMNCAGVYGTCGIERGSDIFQFYVPTFQRVGSVIGWSNTVCALQDDGVPLCWGRQRRRPGGRPALRLELATSIGVFI